MQVYDMQRRKKTRAENQIKPHDASVKQAKGNENGYNKPRENHTMQVYDKQREKKTDVETTGKRVT